MIKLKSLLNEDNSSELKKLEKLMKSHDWYYEMSDDNRVYKRGSAERKVIDNLIMRLSTMGGSKDTAKLLKKYKPERMGSVTTKVIPAPKRPKK